jgi:hypothetical protein
MSDPGVLLFLIKVAVPPLLVAAMSVAARRWGPTFGGLLMGLPWMTGPVLFFLTLDKGAAFGAAASIGVELGVVCICAFMLGYGALTALAPWPVCLGAAAAAFAGTAWATRAFEPTLAQAGVAAATGLALTYLLLPRPRAATPLPALPWWDIPARMLATFALVAAIMVSADALGPQLSGIVSTYPAILTVIGSFTHHQWGQDAVHRVLRSLTLSLFGFVAFFLVVGATLPRLGLAAAFALASITGIAISATSILATRRRDRPR